MATTTAVVSGRELTNPPSDGISNIRFSNHSDHLLVSSWDKTVRLYDATADVLRGEFLHGGPVLDCCFHDDSSGFSASADNTVRRSVTLLTTSDPFYSILLLLCSFRFSITFYSLIFATGKEDILGKHDAPVRCVEYSYAAGTFLTLFLLRNNILFISFQYTRFNILLCL